MRWKKSIGLCIVVGVGRRGNKWRDFKAMEMDV